MALPAADARYSCGVLCFEHQRDLAPKSCSPLGPQKTYRDRTVSELDKTVVADKIGCDRESDLKKRSQLPLLDAPIAANSGGSFAAVGKIDGVLDDLTWPKRGDEIVYEAEQEARILDDLLRLGLELGDLEQVFGNTTVDHSCSRGQDERHARCDAGSSSESDSNDGFGMCDVRGLGEEAPEDDTDDPEALLLDADLQDALLALPELEPARDDQHVQRDYEKDQRPQHCLPVDATTTALYNDSAFYGAREAQISSLQCQADCFAPPPAAVRAATGIAAMTRQCETSLPSVPAPTLSEERAPSGIDAANRVQAARADIVDGSIGADRFLLNEPASSRFSVGGNGDCGDDVLVPSTINVVDAIPCPAKASTGNNAYVHVANLSEVSTKPAATNSAMGVPTNLLDAIGLWESTISGVHALGGRTDELPVSACGVSERTDEDVLCGNNGVAHGSNGSPHGFNGASPSKAGSPFASSLRSDSTSSITKADIKSSSRKKKNEFGKRRRSSGGGVGGMAPPNLDSVRIKEPGGRKIKADPLVALKEVRSLSRKPLIVQWLRSDGFAQDEAAEREVGRAVGSLASIHSHYWGRGG